MTDLEVTLQLSRLKHDAEGVIMGVRPSVEEQELRGIAIEALEELRKINQRAAVVEAKHRDLKPDVIKDLGKTWIRPDVHATIQLLDSSAAGVILAARLLVLKFAGVLHDYRSIVPWPQEEEGREPGPEDE